MPNNTKIIQANDAQKEAILSGIEKQIPGIEKSIYDQIVVLLDEFDSKGGKFDTGYITDAQFLELETKITEILGKSGYIKQANLFIQDLTKITLNSSGILDAIGYGHQKLPLSNIEKKWKRATATSLFDSGINETFKRPIMKVLDDAISFGSSISDTRAALEDIVIGANGRYGKLGSYLTQTARDAVSQMQGQQLQSVANEVGWVGIRYVGGLLNDSRGQCTRWVKELNGFIPKEKLQAEIDLAYKNERNKKVDYVNGHKHKWGGMMPNTTVDNFAVKRGGFNCTHTAIPVRKKP